ncbi:MAG: adenine deaminase C-terminal domain-containing protein [Bdellovibrionota bacterium]
MSHVKKAHSGQTLLRNASLVDVKEKTIRKSDILIRNGVFAPIDGLRAGAKVIDLTGRYLCPGLIDSHTHSELSLMSVAPFAEMLTAFGTTAAIIDCHDFVNVVGMRGLRLLIRESSGTSLRAYFTAPACVPSRRGFEDSGALIAAKDIEAALCLKRVIGLAEVMDTERVLARDAELLKAIRLAKAKGMVIDGHCPSMRSDDEKRYFALSGAKTDHESTNLVELLRKWRMGKWIHLRHTSLGREYSYKEIFKATGGVRIMLATDGCLSPVDVMSDGHISSFIRALMSDGVRPVDAIAAATIVPAECYGLASEIGSISIGNRADFLILSSLDRFVVDDVFIGGVRVIGDGFERMRFPSYAVNTIKARVPEKDDLVLRPPNGHGRAKTVRVNVIGLVKGSLLTRHIVMPMKISSGVVASDIKRDVIKVAVLGRFSPEERPQLGFVKGFGLLSGAFGGSIGQDCQHISVIGTNDADMIKVMETVVENQGGLFYAKDGIIVAGIGLPIGGIMTDAPAQVVAARIRAMEDALRVNGVGLKSPYLALSLMITLAAIPELKLTNRGLLNVRSGRFMDVMVDCNMKKRKDVA